VDDLVANIASASSEQSDGINQVSTAVSEVDKVTQSNAASSEESAAAAHELNAQADTLKEALNKMTQLMAGAQAAAENEAAFTESSPSLPASSKPLLQHSRHVRSTKPSLAHNGRT